MPSRAVVWFRGALRVTDRPALLAALDAGDQVVPVFVVDRALLDGRPSGGGESRGSGPGGWAAGGRIPGDGGPGKLGAGGCGQPDPLTPAMGYAPPLGGLGTGPGEFGAGGSGARGPRTGGRGTGPTPDWVGSAWLDPAIFAPWQANPDDLEAAGVRLGRDYPRPIVDHTTARNHALARSQEATSRRS
jgi:hypothetical protein